MAAWTRFGVQRMEDLGRETVGKIQEAKVDAERDPIHLAFLGPPGVGKGTYASRIAALLDLEHISVGEVVRRRVKERDCEPTLRQDMENGKLLPDEVVSEFVVDRIRENRKRGMLGYVLDGFPRTLKQAKFFALEENLHAVFHLQMREEALLIKLLGRRRCSHCGKEYNIGDVDLPAKDGHPPVRLLPLSPPEICTEHLTRRIDDTPEVIRRRFGIYNETHRPILQFYKTMGVLHDFEIAAGIPETLPALVDACLQAIDTGRRECKSNTDQTK